MTTYNDESIWDSLQARDTGQGAARSLPDAPSGVHQGDLEASVTHAKHGPESFSAGAGVPAAEAVNNPSAVWRPDLGIYQHVPPNHQWTGDEIIAQNVNGIVMQMPVREAFAAGLIATEDGQPLWPVQDRPVHDGTPEFAKRGTGEASVREGFEPSAPIETINAVNQLEVIGADPEILGDLAESVSEDGTVPSETIEALSHLGYGSKAAEIASALVETNVNWAVSVIGPEDYGHLHERAKYDPECKKAVTAATRKAAMGRLSPAELQDLAARWVR